MLPKRYQKFLLVFLGFLVCTLVFWAAGAYFFAGINYPHISKQSSPSGKMTVHEFTSMHDNLGHAPYGRTLSLSLSNTLLKNPDEGYVFFAGYCNTLQYEWKSDDEMHIFCNQGGRKVGARTLASVMYGVKVAYFEK
jgi:hypothetical protein